MTLRERVERLLKARGHWHDAAGAIVEYLPNVAADDNQMAIYATMLAALRRCTDFHGDAREAYLDALALAWELAPSTGQEHARWLITQAAAYAQEEPR